VVPRPHPNCVYTNQTRAAVGALFNSSGGVDSIQRDSAFVVMVASPDGVLRQCPKILSLVYQRSGTTFRQQRDAPKCKFRDSEQPSGNSPIPPNVYNSEI
jgi:hypothetical protein